MTQPFFPGTEDYLILLQDELPDGVYATDRANHADEEKRSYSSAELRAHAQMMEDLATNLQKIYLDKFISLATPDGLAKWEKELFASAQDGNQTIEKRVQNLLAKLRAIGGLSIPAIAKIIDGVLSPVGLTFDLLTYCGSYNISSGIYGAWILDYSSLGLDTFLALRDPIQGTGLNPGQSPLDKNLDYAAAGLTAEELAEIQETAYKYEVRIYGTASVETLTLLDNLLTQLEPARSTHLILNNASKDNS